MKLPHTKILILAAVCLSIIAVVFSVKAVQDQNAYALRNSQNALIVDSSNGTSSVNDQILSALESSELDLINQASTTNPFLPSPKDNLTDRVAKGLFTTYAQGEANGDNAPDTTTAINGIINNIDTSALPQSAYTIGNLTIFAPQNSIQIKNYANQLASIQVSNLSAVAQDPKKFSSDLLALGTIYSSIAEQLMKVPVPAAVASSHLEIANDYLIAAKNFVLIVGQKQDPVKSYLAIKSLQDAANRQLIARTAIVNYIQDNGILFSKEDPGSLLLQTSTTTPEQTTQSQSN